VPDIRAYSDFIRSVGTEHDRIQREQRDGTTQNIDRTYYAAGIPLNADEEQRMLSAILEASKKGKEVDARLGCHQGEKRNELASRSGDGQAVQIVRSSEETCLNAELPIAEEARLALKNELDAHPFRRLDSWVNSLLWERRVYERVPNPCPPNYNPPAGQTTHFACDGFYDFFFRDFGNVEASNRMMDVEGKPREQERFRTRISLPEDKERAVIALGLEASRAINENGEQYSTQSQEFISRNHLQLDPKTRKYPLPPEIEGLAIKHREIVEEYIFKLKQVLGDALFKQFDTVLSAENLSITRPIATPARPDTPGDAQNPAVRQ